MVFQFLVFCLEDDHEQNIVSITVIVIGEEKARGGCVK